MNKSLLLILALLPLMLGAQGVVINEIVASNQTTITDEDDDTPDWIELYNTTGLPVNLTGFSLSDDSLDLQKWKFENSTIPAGDYLLIFASDKDRQTSNLHTNFKISAAGEKIFLSETNGAIVDKVDVPPLLTDISYARESDGSLPWTFQTPTPNASNSGSGYIGYADPVQLSKTDYFYPSAISVELTAGESEIYYTLDGSDPDESSTLYTGKIDIDSTTTIKAISHKDGYLPGPMLFHTYFINENTDLPVVSLTSDPYNLFDPDSGIYTNYTMNWERPAHIEFFEDDKSQGFSENCGIEISGGQSSQWDQKSITIKFKNDYGISELEYLLFPDFDVTTFKGFVLRNAGNDWQFTHMRDALMQTLVKDLDIDYLEYRPATSFINGEYWGIYNIREKINEYYLANRHGVDPDNVDLLENNMKVLQGDSQAYQQLIDYISTNDMTTAAAYAYIDSAIDLNECILYFAAQAYYDNLDWPGTNIKFWRERSASGQWHWILCGLEFGFGLYEHGAWEDHLSFMFSPVETRYSNPPWATLLQRKLIENPTFKNRFINQIADLLNTNFKSERVVQIINTLADHISGEITRHRNRWGLNGESIDSLTTFAQDRPAYLRDHVRNFFDCGNNASLTIDASAGGSVQLNTLKLESSDLPFSGTYFEGNEIHLSAIPEPGFIFAGWSGSLTSQDASLNLSGMGTINLVVSFSVDTVSAKDIVINEINYNSSDKFDSGDWIELFNKSNTNIDLSNWAFSDSDPNKKFVLPEGTILEAGKYLVLVNDDSSFTSRFPYVNNYLGELAFGLNGSGEFIKLTDSMGEVIDSLTYDDEAPWPLEPDGNGATLELINPKFDNSLGANWRAALVHGSPGKENGVVSSVEKGEKEQFPGKFILFQNYPNPFNSVTKIRFELNKTYNVTIKIFDINGRTIGQLNNKSYDAGEHSLAIKLTENLSSGVYFYQVFLDGVIAGTNKMILIR